MNGNIFVNTYHHAMCGDMHSVPPGRMQVCVTSSMFEPCQLPADVLRDIFAGICVDQEGSDGNWYWKEPIAYQEQYQSIDRIIAIIVAIEFMVGGSTRCYINRRGNAVTSTFFNDGYYKNVGA